MRVALSWAVVYNIAHPIVMTSDQSRYIKPPPHKAAKLGFITLSCANSTGVSKILRNMHRHLTSIIGSLTGTCMLLGFSRTIEFTQLTELKFSLNIVMLRYAIQKSGVKV